MNGCRFNPFTKSGPVIMSCNRRHGPSSTHTVGRRGRLVPTSTFWTTPTDRQWVRDGVCGPTHCTPVEEWDRLGAISASPTRDSRKGPRLHHPTHSLPPHPTHLFGPPQGQEGTGWSSGSIPSFSYLWEDSGTAVYRQLSVVVRCVSVPGRTDAGSAPGPGGSPPGGARNTKPKVPFKDPPLVSPTSPLS